LLAVLTLAAPSLTGCLRGAHADDPFAVNGIVAPVALRHVSPHLVGATLTRQHLDIAAWRGHVVVVNVWGSWCAPCRREAPELARVAAKTAREGVRFLGIDVRDNRASARTFEAEFHIRYPSLFDPGGTQALQFRPLTGQAVPYTFILDRRGRVAARFLGPTSYEPLYESVELTRTGRVPTR
jgi:thiol-disulfide isomerase/thioredoxin